MKSKRVHFDADLNFGTKESEVSPVHVPTRRSFTSPKRLHRLRAMCWRSILSEEW